MTDARRYGGLHERWIDAVARHQKGAPGPGRVRVAGKWAVEHALWGRVAVQRAWESRVGWTRPIPRLVPPTAVLKSRAEWMAAVDECRRLRLPLHFTRAKNWDALGAVGAVLSLASPDARVVDAGAARYSTVLPWLRLYGLTDLTGINLEFGKEFRHGPVRFRYGDATATDFRSGSLDAVTCMSVIEHAVSVPSFLAEAARILRKGGVLCISTDYDKQPPNTAGRAVYGVPVRIFGPDDIHALVSQAADAGLDLVGELSLDHPERPFYWGQAGLRYTFLLLTFVRR